MKNKKINFRISEEFLDFLKVISSQPKYRIKGINNVSDFIRYSFLKTIRYEQGIDTLDNKKHIPEIKKYFNPLK